MSELEPTRTSSDLTATEQLCRMLDERGVEWEDGGEGLTIIPVQDGVPQAWTVDTWPSGKDTGDCLWVQNRHPLTPEQAIAATLGSCNCSNGCTNGERMETCHPIISDNLAESEGTGDAWADCSECGHLLFVLTDPNSQVPNFCPNCGRRVEQ